MRVLIVGAADPWTRSVATLHRYCAWGKRLGHEVAILGEPSRDLPHLRYTNDVEHGDIVLFILQVPSDLPPMPLLARLLDVVPRERRFVLDLWGRYNETIRLDHDFNHLEKLDGHPAWEWIEAIDALGATVLQPTLQPRRAGVTPFLFHGFDASEVARPHASAAEAAAAWRSADRVAKPYGFVYVGSNWQRWTQVRSFLQSYSACLDAIGQPCLAGWDWNERPQWAVDMGLHAIDTDPDLLADLRVEVRQGVRFDRVVELVGQGRFAPVFHRPTFRELGLVTNRTFETFLSDSVPVLMLPRPFVEGVYGSAALELVPGDDLAGHLKAVDGGA